MDNDMDSIGSDAPVVEDAKSADGDIPDPIYIPLDNGESPTSDRNALEDERGLFGGTPSDILFNLRGLNGVWIDKNHSEWTIGYAYTGPGSVHITDTSTYIRPVVAYGGLGCPTVTPAYTIYPPISSGSTTPTPQYLVQNWTVDEGTGTYLTPQTPTWQDGSTFCTNSNLKQSAGTYTHLIGMIDEDGRYQQLSLGATYVPVVKSAADGKYYASAVPTTDTA